MTQTKAFIKSLEALGLPYTFEIKEIVTKGDQIVDRMLSKVGGKGLFVKEIEQALLDKEIDFAVHSMKDMPAELPPGLIIGCIPEREDPRDCLISKDHQPLEKLPEGAVLGTSSLRRSAQLLHKRPDLKVQWIRGNIDTRLRKLKEEGYDAIILAVSGLKRMGWSHETITEYLEPEICLPAVGQGALGIECRQDDQEILQLLQHVHDTTTGVTVQAERAFLAKMEGSCQVPIAAQATLEQGMIKISGLVGSPDGKLILQDQVEASDPVAAGLKLADSLLHKGARELLDQVKKENKQ